MKGLATALAAVIALLSLFAGTVFAAEDPLPKLTIQKLDVQVFDKLIDYKTSSIYGIRETLAPEGKVLVLLDFAVQPEWTDKIDKAAIDDKEIKLVLADGSEVLMTGHFERSAMFRVEANRFYAWRPSDWKEKTKVEYFNAVFAVPAGATDAELHFGPVTAPVKIAGPPAPPADPLGNTKIEITSAGFVDSVANTRSVGDLKAGTAITNPFGKILEVKIKITPEQGNGNDPDHFFWYTPWIGLRTGNGQWCMTFGEMFMQGLSQGVSHNLSRSSGGTFNSGEATFYFPVPADLKTYQLIYLGRPAAEGQV